MDDVLRKRAPSGRVRRLIVCHGPPRDGPCLNHLEPTGSPPFANISSAHGVAGESVACFERGWLVDLAQDVRIDQLNISYLLPYSV